VDVWQDPSLLGHPVGDRGDAVSEARDADARDGVDHSVSALGDQLDAVACDEREPRRNDV
jgi:hypothetical protein